MAQSYIPEGTMVICTEMKSPKDNSVISNRSKATVIHQNKEVILLNKSDLKLQTEFVCNINSKFWGGLKMLGAIVAVGALAIATVATGGLALVAVGVAVAAIGTSAFSSFKEVAHNCDATLTSKWIGYHSSVRFNGDNALLQTSNMICSKGGGLTLVVDPVLARAAAQKISENNTKEYDAHINSQIIQGGMFVLSSNGDPRALAFGFPLTVSNYAVGENKKIDERAENIEARITGAQNPEQKGTLTTVWGAVPDGEGTFNAGRDAAIGVMTEASYSPEMITAIANNAAIIKAYPAIVKGSLGTSFPMASLRLNSSIYFAAARHTFNPGVIKSLGTGFAWGMGGAIVDGASDEYENSVYKDTLIFFEKLIKNNKKSKGINIIAYKD
ncbi:hypothetical protein [Chryseobacterium sp. CT-SW4]|uniref:hypothetical protein n=1 Tax=Chryseobacterium sp. SW-1 TaxID=3157343 RepID=UPI003B0269D5